MHLVYPPAPQIIKKKFQNSFLLRISPGYYSHPSHVMVMQNLGWRGRRGGGGGNKVHYGLCENGEFGIVSKASVSK